jgi:hypothetical protein
MNTAATNRIAAAIRAARLAGSALGLSFGSARWEGCKSRKVAYSQGDGCAVRLEATAAGWSLRGRDGGFIASGQA